MGVSMSTTRSASLECLLNDLENSCLRNSIERSKSLSSMLTDARTAVEFSNQHLIVCPATLFDCHLRAVCKGNLELRSHNLIFSDRERSFTWPLWTLRWYGENKKFFVFESGQRCASGPGLFLFKCKNSKKLISCLDNSIRQILYQRALGADPPFLDRVCHSNLHSQPGKFEVHLYNERTFPVRTERLLSDSIDNSDPCSGPSNTTATTNLNTRSLQSTTHLALATDSLNSDNYLNALPSVPSDSSFTDQYLIPVAPHPYVNQPDRWQSEASDIPVRVVQNDYVIQPA